MPTNTSCQLIILDNKELICLLAAQLRSRSFPITPSGAGFAQGYQFKIDKTEWHILRLPQENSARLAWLSVIEFSLHRSINRIIGIAGAHSLINNLRPGDLTLVHKASAMPYPGLYETRDPYSGQTISGAEHYYANTKTLQHFNEFMNLHLRDITWQSIVPSVHSVYVKNPLSEGSLLPWASEQLDSIRDQGVETLSDLPAGLYDAQTQLSATEVICINQIQSTPSPDSQALWRRHQNQYHCAPLGLLSKLITG